MSVRASFGKLDKGNSDFCFAFIGLLGKLGYADFRTSGLPMSVRAFFGKLDRGNSNLSSASIGLSG